MSKVTPQWQDSREAPCSFYTLVGHILATVGREENEGEVSWMAQVYSTRESTSKPSREEAKKWVESTFEHHRHEAEDYLTVEGVCPVTARKWSVKVRREGYDTWKAGTTIQKALPELTDDEREQLISGMTPEGFEIVFGREEGQTEGHTSE